MTIKGYSNQEKRGEQQYATLQNLGSGRYGLDVIQRVAYQISALPKAITSDSTEKLIIYSTAHGAREGDFIRFIDGNNKSIEAPILQIIDANTIKLSITIPSMAMTGDEFHIMRPISLTTNESGELVVSQGSIQYVLDGAAQQVIEDTLTPANNKSLPSKLFVKKDGILSEVVRDTVIPANNVALPVEIIGVSGTTINITAGDINVSLSHLGINYDSVRIGDGTNLLGMDGDKAKVKDADVKAVLDTIDADTGAIATSTGSIDTKLGSLATQTTAADILAKIIAAPSTEAKQDTLITAIGGLLSELQGKTEPSDTQPVSAAALPLPTGASTSAKQDDLYTRLGLLLTELGLKADLTETQPVSLASQPLPTGAATLAVQATQQTSLNLLTDRLAGSLAPVKHDEVALTYVTVGNGIGEIATVVYKLATVTVATLTLSYDVNNKLSGVVRS